MLDPVARHDFMATVMTAMAADGVSVVPSSHVLAELERVAGYLILLSRGRVQLAGEVDALLASHRLLTGPAADIDRYAERPVVHADRAEAQAHLPVQAAADDPVPPLGSVSWLIRMQRHLTGRRQSWTPRSQSCAACATAARRGCCEPGTAR